MKLIIYFLCISILQVKAVPVVDPFYISTFCFFVVPMTLICVLYILIGIKLKNSKTLHGIKRDNCEIAHSTLSSQTRIIRMLSMF